MKKLLLILFFAITACTATVEETVRTEIDPLVMRPAGAAGETVVYDMTTGERAFSLPMGRISADHTLHFTAEPTERTTTLTRYDALTGAEQHVSRFKAHWELAGLSPNGKWAVLAHENESQSVIQVVDTATDEVANEITLKGSFEVEAISNDGASLYLIEHLEADDKYRVRLYDLTINELQPDPLRDKRVQDEVMTGYAWGTVQDPTGEWLLTLYVNTARSAAFIHALNLNNSATFCLDLPSDNADFATLQQYTMAIAPDKQTVFAANPVLGVVTEISLFDLGDPPTLTHFDAVELTKGDMQQASAISADGDNLFFAHNDTLWQYDTVANSVQVVYQADAPIDSMALRDDTLFVAEQNGQLQMVAGVAKSLKRAEK